MIRAVHKKNIHNNKGISLVEILIALAIGSIVLTALGLLVQQCVRGYTRQTVNAQLQNDADITLNQLEGDIMESNTLVIDNTGRYHYLFTHKSVNESQNTVYYSGYIYDSGDISDGGHILYYADNMVKSQAGVDVLPAGSSVVCENVSDFGVYIAAETVRYNDEQSSAAINYVNPNIRITLNITLEKNMFNTDARTVTRQVLVRNRFDVKEDNPDKSDVSVVIEKTENGAASLILKSLYGLSRTEAGRYVR